MMKWTQAQWRDNAKWFPGFLTPFAKSMGRSERREGAALYVEGLLLSGERKSIEPMAERLGVDSQKLQQLITDSPWDDQAVWRAIRQEIPTHLEPLWAWIVDETGWLKQGEHSVGVSHQYCGAVGKSAHCQVHVEVAVTDGQAAVPIGARLYLPEKWTQDLKRCQEAGVPDGVKFATKPQIALDLIKEALADHVARAPVLGDAAYGNNGDFRDGLRQLGLEFFLQIDASQLLGWAKPVALELKRTLWHVQENQAKGLPLAKLFAGLKSIQWHHCSWQAAAGKTRRTRLAWMKVYLAGALERGATRLEELWLVVDWPETEAEPYHYYLAHLHRPPHPARLLQLSRSRWNIEQYFQRAKTDLGLDHFEGRSWRGFHHHLVMAVLAYIFVTVIYLRAKKNFWCDLGTNSEKDPSLVAAVDRVLPLLRSKI